LARKEAALFLAALPKVICYLVAKGSGSFNETPILITHLSSCSAQCASAPDKMGAEFSLNLSFISFRREKEPTRICSVA
jgi:hypothetical protein